MGRPTPTRTHRAPAWVAACVRPPRPRSDCIGSTRGGGAAGGFVCSLASLPTARNAFAAELWGRWNYGVYYRAGVGNAPSPAIPTPP